MKKHSFIVMLTLLLLAGACNKKSDVENIVTQRIQYDVSIKNTDPEFDWWEQNLDGEKRETLIRQIITGVAEGKVKAYDFISNRQLSTQEINQMLHRTDSISMERAEPPHELYDTVITRDLELKNITRLRFLEEWRMDEKTLAFSKKVAGYCPLLEVFDESGELRGYRPLFWVFLDDQYPGKLKNH